jgi:hypothetical protein
MAEQDPNNVPLREYTERLIVDLEKTFNVKFDANQEAVDKAERRMEIRLEGMNEFRLQLKDQAAAFLPRSEYSVAHDKLGADITDLRKTRDEMAGKANASSVYVAYALAGIGILISIIQMFAK